MQEAFPSSVHGGQTAGTMSLNYGNVHPAPQGPLVFKEVQSTVDPQQLQPAQQVDMRPAFILLALAAFVAASPLQVATGTEIVARSVDNTDAVAVEAYYDWLQTHDEASMEDTRAFLKSALAAVKTAAITHGKAALASVVASGCDKVQEKLAARTSELADDIVEQAYQDWLDSIDGTTIYATPEFFKSALAAVKSAVVTHGKAAVADLAAQGCEHIQSKIAGAGAPAEEPAA
ncbi:hypothetical protein EYR40_002034 [Pleurotus pulmonarius]|nr:hypothetical protein EYR40_002034 [Pleurotus pulmonarius]KAF4607529.1 hypothetical protein EYR38_001601 [Pleurotus pulmonarius]